MSNCCCERVCIPTNSCHPWKISRNHISPLEAFFSQLTQQHFSEDDCAHAQAVWDTFRLQTLGNYPDLYVKNDVLQLADVFQNFRKLCTQFYGLDHRTRPAWQASLKMPATYRIVHGYRYASPYWTGNSKGNIHDQTSLGMCQRRFCVKRRLCQAQFLHYVSWCQQFRRSFQAWIPTVQRIWMDPP